MLHLPPVVALSGAAGAGKSSAADHLIATHGYTRLKFAGPLKAMLRAIGLTDAHIEGELKEAPCDLLQGRTPRQAMIWLGTEYGRNMIGPFFWTGLWAHQAKAILAEGGRVVVDDCRFANEAEAARALGGLVLRLRRPSVEGRISHASEAHDFEADREILNTGGVEALPALIDQALASYQVHTWAA